MKRRHAWHGDCAKREIGRQIPFCRKGGAGTSAEEDTGLLVESGGTEDEMEGEDYFSVHSIAGVTMDIGGVDP